MMHDIPRRMIERVATMSDDEHRVFIGKCSVRTLLAIDAMFETWSHDGQIAPSAEGWRVWLMLAGRGFGKTRAGAEWILRLGNGPSRRIALVGASIDEARSVMVEGPSGLLSIARRHRLKLKWEPSLNRLSWPRGSVAQLFSGDHPDGLRGPEHDFAWADELAKWRRVEAAWTNLQMGLRRGVRPRALVTTTPKSMAVLTQLRKDPWTVETGGKTGDNLSLPKHFIEVMTATYAGTRLGRQEMDGEYMAEAEGSLFPRDLIERCRADAPDRFDRIVVGVDPPITTDGDACGIVVAGREGGNLYVLADCTLSGASPERWARAVAGAYAAWGASHVVAEANQGGAMVASVLRGADASLPVRLVHASQGKSARAEPVAARFEAGRAWFAGVFPELEAELAGLGVGGAYDGPGRSPDRADACVWALTELSETKSGMPRIRAL